MQQQRGKVEKNLKINNNDAGLVEEEWMRYQRSRQKSSFLILHAILELLLHGHAFPVRFKTVLSIF